MKKTNNEITKEELKRIRRFPPMNDYKGYDMYINYLDKKFHKPRNHMMDT